MVQPRMQNAFERMVVCLGGSARYVAANLSNSSAGKAFDIDIAIDFAQEALNYAKARLGDA